MKTQSEIRGKNVKLAVESGSVPRIINTATLDDHLEIITQAIFQSGLSWAMISSRWGAFRIAFEDFHVNIVANYDDFDLERLMSTDHIIHSANKIRGTFSNARMLLAIERDFGSITNYISSFDKYTSLFEDAHHRFKFMGDLNCYYWLFRSTHVVPRFEDWIARQAKDHPRMREMVLSAREKGLSNERADF